MEKEIEMNNALTELVIEVAKGSAIKQNPEMVEAITGLFNALVYKQLNSIQ